MAKKRPKINQAIIPQAKLDKVYWQHAMTYDFYWDLRPGAIVFLKSNPERPLMVEGGKDGLVICSLLEDAGVEFLFHKEMLCEYRYAGLMVSKDGKFKISLN